jgi:hypothetical protein
LGAGGSVQGGSASTDGFADWLRAAAVLMLYAHNLYQLCARRKLIHFNDKRRPLLSRMKNRWQNISDEKTGAD